ncbi:response regulator [Aquicoccus sp. SCR17]|nr:response regulator [Carideicomes alvinocaridis]
MTLPTPAEPAGARMLEPPPEMPTARNASQMQEQLAAFDRRTSRRGRLLQYLQARIGYFLFRQIVTLFGFCVLALAGAPWVGLLCATVAGVTECLELFGIRRLRRAVEAGMDLPRAERLSAGLSVFQATGISLAITIGGLSQPPLHAALYCFSYHGGAMVVAGIGLRAAPRQIALRLMVHVAAMGGLLFYDLFWRHGNPLQFYFDGTGMLLMLFWLWLVVAHLAGLDRRQEAANRAILMAQTETLRANKDLRRQQETLRRMSLVARHARDGLIITDHEGTILWVNEAFSDMTGYRPDEAVGRQAAALLMRSDNEAEELADLRDALLRKQPFRGVFAQYSKTGELTWIDKHVVPIQGPDGEIEYALSVDRDVTEDRAKARELAEAKARAERGERARAEFLATMSHEIRTPMHGISGMVELLDKTELGPEQRLYTETIRSSAEALLTIINDVLDLSKLDSGKLDVAPAPFSPRDCIGQVVQLLRPQADAKALQLALEVDPDLPARASADAGRLRQILVNLLGNAIKFTRQGGVDLTVTHRPAGAAGGPTGMEIAVRDTGIGIPPDRLDDIFEPFRQAEDGTTTRNFGGTGLGLTISRLLARRMGGDISVRSTPGAGSCFTLTLPLAPVADAPAASEPAPDPAALPEGLRVLVAEDNGTNRLILDKFLRGAPIRLSFALNGAEALEAHRADPADVVLMDMAMPVMDGLEATRRIRANQGPQPWIVALTANAFDSDREACLAAGMDDFLTKPVRRAELLDRLARASAAPRRPG